MAYHMETVIFGDRSGRLEVSKIEKYRRAPSPFQLLIDLLFPSRVDVSTRDA